MIEFRNSPEVAGKLCVKNLALVHYFARKLAKKIHLSADEYEQIVSAATHGLLLACYRFDTDRGIELSTYAKYYIRRSINREMVAIRSKGFSGTTWQNYKVEIPKFDSSFDGDAFEVECDLPDDPDFLVKLKRLLNKHLSREDAEMAYASWIDRVPFAELSQRRGLNKILLRSRFESIKLRLSKQPEWNAFLDGIRYGGSAKGVG